MTSRLLHFNSIENEISNFDFQVKNEESTFSFLIFHSKFEISWNVAC